MNKSKTIAMTLAPALVLMAGASLATDDPTLSSGYATSAAVNLMHNMETADANDDGMISEDEFVSYIDRVGPLMFDHMDSDDDGMISHDEMMTAMAGDTLKLGR